jgi:hypothetical protein
MSNPYRYPEVGHVFRQCLLCGKTKRVEKGRIAKGEGKFCTKQCLFRAWQLFSAALASDRFGPVLEEIAAAAGESYSGKGRKVADSLRLVQHS